MLNAGNLTIWELAVREPLPLAQIQESVLEFLRGREDTAVLGAQAVNAYVGEARMTQGIDLLSTRAEELAGKLREHLTRKFHIALRVREVAGGKGFWLYQTQKTGSRHLVDLRFVKELPATKKIENIQVLSPVPLIASKVISYYARRGKPKSGTDWCDLAMLLLTFPKLKSATGAVADHVKKATADDKVLVVWRELVAQDFKIEKEDEDLDF
jgi:hypothetical protein